MTILEKTENPKMQATSHVWRWRPSEWLLERRVRARNVKSWCHDLKVFELKVVL